MQKISEKLIGYLLGNIDGFSFERLIQKILGSIYKDQFVTLGGIHDGGADGFFRSVLENTQRTTNFVQISTQENVKVKIRQTIERLNNFGRNVKSLTYYTSRKLSVDTLEESLSNELDITITIRDWDYINRLINKTNETIEIFNEHFRREIFELTTNQASHAAPEFDVVSDPSVYVFLQFECTERFHRGGAVSPIVDSLIYWSLRETEPDTPKLLSRSSVKDKISQLIPAAASTIIPNIDSRLKILCGKNSGGEQRVRHYQKTDSFCLPHFMRQQLATESAVELELKAIIKESLIKRANAYGAIEPGAVAQACERAIYRHFHQQGLVLAAFLDKKLSDITISDQIVEEELKAVALEERLSEQSYTVTLKVLQSVFYSPSDAERDFLHKLSKTSLLLFTLKHNPKVIEYFNKMTGKFRLIVGSDIIIKALSETFLDQKDQHVTNILKIAKTCGAQLILADPVVDEVFTHINATNLEFKNHYSQQESHITSALASQSDRILIRTYFYAKLITKQVLGWKRFIELFLDYEELSRISSRGKTQLRAYIAKTFNFDTISRDDLAKGINHTTLEKLSTSLSEKSKKNINLAQNDALIALAIYAQRVNGKEIDKYDGFGLKTWWLTKETTILQHTGDIVREHDGVPFIMRPEFLLNFLTNSPQVRIDPVLQDLLPSHVGLQIGQHLSSSHMHKLLNHVQEWDILSEARREIKISDAIDKLKYDRLKRYESNFDLTGETEADIVISSLRG